MGMFTTATLMAMAIATTTPTTTTLDLRSCEQQRLVSVAVLRTSDSGPAALALEEALAPWRCVRLQQVTRAVGATVDITNDDRDRGNALEIDWLITVSGTEPLLRARLFDPVTLDVLAAAEGSAADIVGKLLEPVAVEITAAREGGGRVGVVVSGVTHGEFRALENSLRGLDGVTDIDAGSFRGGRGEFVLRSLQPRRRFLDTIDGVVVGKKVTAVTAVRPRRIELVLK